MKDIMGTAAVIAGIAVFVVLMFLGPKGFQMGQPDPIAASADETADGVAPK